MKKSKLDMQLQYIEHNLNKLESDKIAINQDDRIIRFMNSNFQEFENLTLAQLKKVIYQVLKAKLRQEDDSEQV